MEYSDFKKLIDSLIQRGKETEWIEFKQNFHSKEPQPADLYPLLMKNMFA